MKTGFRRTAFAIAAFLLATATRGQTAARDRAGAPPLDDASADRFARLALTCIDREFPNKPEHVLDGPADAKAPREFHPAFFGCYDWHSSVHGHWMLVRLLALRPGMPLAPEIRSRLAPHFSKEAIASEVSYLDRKSARSFERTYGWAWVLRLALELERGGRSGTDPELHAWRESFRPLEAAVAGRLADFLPKLSTPIRTGVHPNTAFALAEALDWARGSGGARAGEIEKLVLARSRAFYGGDRACPFAYEPSGEDFFSPCLEEADLMRRVLPAGELSPWLDRFWSALAKSGVSLSPAVVSDPTDPKLVHLDGLNLSRAWALGGIASALPPRDARREKLERSAREHARAGLARVSSGNYEGEHWLASFAIRLTLDAGP